MTSLVFCGRSRDFNATPTHLTVCGSVIIVCVGGTGSCKDRRVITATENFRWNFGARNVYRWYSVDV